MKNQYNLSNLEAQFKEWLQSGIYDLGIKKPVNYAPNIVSKVTVKNYISDIKHFFGWLLFYLKAQKIYDKFANEFEMLKGIDKKIINDYVNYLLKNNLPVKTINRRLSSLRKFFNFCLLQMWISSNPIKEIPNIKNNTAQIQLKRALEIYKQEKNMLEEESKIIAEFIKVIS